MKMQTIRNLNELLGPFRRINYFYKRTQKYTHTRAWVAKDSCGRYLGWVLAFSLTEKWVRANVLQLSRFVLLCHLFTSFSNTAKDGSQSDSFIVSEWSCRRGRECFVVLSFCVPRRVHLKSNNISKNISFLPEIRSDFYGMSRVKRLQVDR